MAQTKSLYKATGMPSFTVHDGIADLMHKYDGFILDQFGVMVRKQNCTWLRLCLSAIAVERHWIIGGCIGPTRDIIMKIPLWTLVGWVAASFAGWIGSPCRPSRSVAACISHHHQRIMDCTYCIPDIVASTSPAQWDNPFTRCR